MRERFPRSLRSRFSISQKKHRAIGIGEIRAESPHRNSLLLQFSLLSYEAMLDERLSASNEIHITALPQLLSNCIQSESRGERENFARAETRGELQTCTATNL
jgi:hypothetical protein